MKRSKRNRENTFNTRRGILLSVWIAALFILVFLFVYYVYLSPMQRSLE
jgi:hypothetical protein